MNIRGFAIGAVLASTLVGTASAQSQPWLQDRRYREGPGIRTGNLEIHPGVAGEVGYDTNYFQRADDEDPIDVVRLRLTPSIFLSTLTEQRRGNTQPTLAFRGGVAASYNEFFGFGDLSDAVRENRNVGITSSLDFNFFPRGKYGARLYGNYTRQFQPSNSPDTNFAFDRNILVYGLEGIWRPGGGLLSWSLGYQGQATLFERQRFENLSNLRHSVVSRGRWRFLPRTSLLYDANVGFIDYGDDAPVLNNSMPVRARVGVSGLITAKLAALGMVGWGASFYDNTFDVPVQDFDSVIGQAELKYFLQAAPDDPSESVSVGLSTIALGYTRDFYDSFIGDFYQRDRVYGRFNYFLGGIVVVTTEGGYSRINHPVSYFRDATTDAPEVRFGEFGENRIDLVLSAEYRVVPTVGINATFRYDANLTENRIPVNDAGAVDNLQFTRVQAYLGARWFM